MSQAQAIDAAPQSPPPLDPVLGIKLSVMMFLQYAIWGAWLPILFPFLMGHRKLPLDKVSAIFAVGAAGAIVAPFVAGQIADRWFNTERFLGISHLVGAALVWQLSWMNDFSTLMGFSLVYSIVYSPTLPLTNSLAFHHLPDRDRDFGKVRLWGTIGWICVGIAMGQWLLHRHTPATGTPEAISAAQQAGMADAFKFSAVLGALMGVFCFLLPATPPKRGKQANATLEALTEVARQPLLTLFLLAVPVSCIHQFYFVHTSAFVGAYQAKAEGFTRWVNAVFGVGGGGLMTIGQMSEMLVLAAIPFVSKKLPRKALLAAGLTAYGLRMALFAYAPALPEQLQLAAIVLGIAMHGLCFGCFIFVAFMVVDEETTGDVRASAQSLFNLVIIGVGIIVGSFIAGRVGAYATVDGKTNYTRLFSVPMWASVVCLLALLAAYPNRRRAPAVAA
jgi:nucleoside transporter